ncbi:VWA domain-containing protein [bacterium]|nr:VWA domain-containing protein [bacterium]
MNKRLIKIGFLILLTAIVGKFLFVLSRNIKVDEFHKASVIFILDSSQSNQKMLPEEIKYIKSLCAILDPEDSVKILKTANSSYLIYEGSPGDTKGINNAISAFTKSEGGIDETAYSQALKKAVNYTLTMKKEGFVPSIVVVGDLADEGPASARINWQILPDNIKKAQQYIPELAMMFVYAPPEKLDLVKTKLNPVLGEKKLIIANSENVDKANLRFLKAIGR